MAVSVRWRHCPRRRYGGARHGRRTPCRQQDGRGAAGYLKLASREELETIQTLAFRVNEVLKAYFLGLGMTLVDFKAVFSGISYGDKPHRDAA